MDLLTTCIILFSYRFIDLDGPLHLSEDPVVNGYEGKIVSLFTKVIFQMLKILQFSILDFLVRDTVKLVTLCNFMCVVSGPVYEFRNDSGNGGFFHWDNTD